jgi:hypothetical protein
MQIGSEMDGYAGNWAGLTEVRIIFANGAIKKGYFGDFLDHRAFWTPVTTNKIIFALRTHESNMARILPLAEDHQTNAWLDSAGAKTVKYMYVRLEGV